MGAGSQDQRHLDADLADISRLVGNQSDLAKLDRRKPDLSDMGSGRANHG